MNTRLTLALLAATLVSFAAAQPQDAPWPMSRYDRWGTARQPVGPDPSLMRTPWMEIRLTPGEFTSHAPAIAADGIVYYGSWLTNFLRKVDSNTGAVLGAFDALEWIKSTPAIGGDGSVYFNVPQTHGSVPGRLYSINPDIMDFNWFYNTNQSSDIDFDHCCPILGPDGNILTGSTTGVAYCFLQEGSVLWERPGLSVINFNLAMTRDDSKVIVPNGTKVTALNYSDGTVAWSFNTGSNVGCPGVAPDGSVVIGTDGGTIYALNPDTGVVKWTKVALDKVRGAPAFGSGNAYICSYDKRLYSFRMSDGFKNWSVLTTEQLMQGPIVGSDDRIYCNGRSGQVTCATPAGTVSWQINTTRESRSPMSMDDHGRLFIPAASGGNGMMVISQAFFEADPTAVSLTRGTLVSGGLAELLTVDQNYYTAKKGLVVNLFEPPIQIVVDTVSPTPTLARIDVSLVAGVSTPNLTQRIEAFDWGANAYVVLDTSLGTLGDSTRNVTWTTNPTRFVNGTNGVRFRVTYKPAGPVATTIWSARLDYIHFQFSPGFVP